MVPFEPAAGRLCLEFANTVSGRRARAPEDRLQGYADFVVWAGQVGALPLAQARALTRAARRQPAGAGVPPELREPAADRRVGRLTAGQPLLWPASVKRAGSAQQAGVTDPGYRRPQFLDHRPDLGQVRQRLALGDLQHDVGGQGGEALGQARVVEGRRPHVHEQPGAPRRRTGGLDAAGVRMVRA